eukprot:9487691-Pyramimonas_sp.AAC.1
MMSVVSRYDDAQNPEMEHDRWIEAGPATKKVGALTAKVKKAMERFEFGTRDAFLAAESLR